MSDALKVSSDVFFYQLGEQANAKTARSSAGRPSSASAARPASTSGRGAGPGAGPQWRDTASRSTRRAWRRSSLQIQTVAALTSAAASSARGRRATTSTSPSARAICRRRRCRSRSPTPRWPTTARSSRRTSARRSRTATASRSRSCRTSRGARSRSTRRIAAVVLDGLRRAASEDGGHVGRRLQGLPVQVYGKTGTVERGPNPDQAWYACFVKDGEQADRGRRDGRARRLRRGNCGTRGAPDPLAVVRCEGPRVQRRLRHEQLSAIRSNPLPSRRPRWCRGNGACAWTRCFCWPRSGWSRAR